MAPHDASACSSRPAPAPSSEGAPGPTCRRQVGASLPASRHEVRTRWVVALTAATMVAELVVGQLTHSLALTADGWHMATHAGALGLAAAAYWFARTRARAAQFAFGTGKVYALAGYTNAALLLVVALFMIGESVQRLIHPVQVHFAEAFAVAAFGLGVNVVSAWLLAADDASHPAGHDHNHRAAYLHVLADLVTSVLALVALLGARYLGWALLDPLVALVGSAVILQWGVGLCRRAMGTLLDMVPQVDEGERVRRALEAIEGTTVVDLHLWELGPGCRAAVVALRVRTARPLDVYRAVVGQVVAVEHLTIEVEATPPITEGA